MGQTETAAGMPGGRIGNERLSAVVIVAAGILIVVLAAIYWRMSYVESD
jgi:hypothetical protein